MNLTKKEVIDIIERFLNKTDNPWDWDDFISIKLKNSDFEKIRLICSILPDKFPPKEINQYCNDKGIELLKKIVLDLKSGDIKDNYGFEDDLIEIKQKRNLIKAKILLFISLFIFLLILIVYK